MTRLPSILLSIAALGFASAAADYCKVINSISYCNAVSAIVYNDIGYSGSYQDVVGYDPDACTCSYAPKSFSGNVAPLNEQLSVHVRGPVTFKKFAVYTPGSSPTYKKRHAHHAHHKRHQPVVTSTITQYVTVVDGEGGEAPPTSTSTPKGSYDEPKKVKEVHDTAHGEWVRQSYYDSESQTRENLIFMNHHGGDKSGVFDYCIGNSLSYADCEGTAGSAEPTTLKDKTLLSDQEVVLFSGEKCDDSCGYVRPGVPAHKGFGGDKKIFLFEFGMPEDHSSSSNEDMPSIWLLNAKIPRSAQFGKKAGGDGKTSCACWESGCGELDVFEVLKDACSYVKTHYHSKQGAIGDGDGGGGCQDYFARPYAGTIKAAVVFDGSKSVTITILPDGTDFPESFDDKFVHQCTKKGATTGIFKVPS